MMITSIQGLLTSATPLNATIELNGFGYEVNIPVTTAEKLPPPGVAVKLHTHVIYREDAQTLYGFSTATDRDFFKLMIDHVTGVGPKGALGIMSRLSVDLLEGAIRSGDVGMLAKCPGIGKKTAERLIVELKGKVGTNLAVQPVATMENTADRVVANTHRDAVAALIALGYKTADADTAVRRAALVLGAQATTETLVKKALT